MRLHERIELVFIPVMEATLALGFLKFFIKMLKQSLIGWVSFVFHVYFELNILDLLNMSVELEGWDDKYSLKFSTLSFFMLVVSALHELVLLGMCINL